MKRKTFHVISCQFKQQPEEKALFKSRFSQELGEMKENIFIIVRGIPGQFLPVSQVVQVAKKERLNNTDFALLLCS